MKINLILIPFVILFGLLMGINDTRSRRKWYIILCSAVLIFVAAMRNPEFMTYTYYLDSLNYKYYFDNSLDMGWGEFWSTAIGRYIGLNSDGDIGFIGLEKIIGFFTHDFYIYSLLIDLLFFIPFGLLLYRYSTSMSQVVFAFVFYIALLQVYLLGGMRQMFALGFDMMALLAIMNRKKWLTIVLFLVGVTIHFSSFLFAIPLLMIWFNITPKALKRLHVFCLVLLPIVYIMPKEIVVLMGEISGLEKYANYGRGAIEGGANFFIILIETLSLFCLIAIREKDIINSKVHQGLYVMVPFFTLFAPLIRSNGAMIRITLYFFVYLTLLTPYAIECMFKKKDKTIVYVFAIGALAFLAVSGGGMRYFFYWQNWIR